MTETIFIVYMGSPPEVNPLTRWWIWRMRPDMRPIQMILVQSFRERKRFRDLNTMLPQIGPSVSSIASAILTQKELPA
ncbi:hypothetical protein B0H19DRAFT_1143608 [Mycena capillaripes]|nr:hypothetical protein B0H19DRAFT_1143608 [Mycena capillaripes]